MRIRISVCIRQSTTVDCHIFLASADGLCAIRVSTSVQGYNRETTTSGNLAVAIDTILDKCLQQQHRGGYISGFGESSRLRNTVCLTADRRRRSSSRQRNLQHRRPNYQMFRYAQSTTHRDRMRQDSRHHTRNSREADLRTKTELPRGSCSTTGIPGAQTRLRRLLHRHQCSPGAFDHGLVVALVFSGKYHQCNVCKTRQRRPIRRLW